MLKIVKLRVNVKRETSKLDPDVRSVMGWPTTTTIELFLSCLGQGKVR